MTGDGALSVLAYTPSLSLPLVSFFLTQRVRVVTQFVCMQVVFSLGSTVPNEGSVKGSRPPHSLRLIRRIDFKKKTRKTHFCYTQNSRWYCFWPTLSTSRTLPVGQWEFLMRPMELEVSEAWNNLNISCLHLVAWFLFTLETPIVFYHEHRIWVIIRGFLLQFLDFELN